MRNYNVTKQVKEEVLEIKNSFIRLLEAGLIETSKELSEFDINVWSIACYFGMHSMTFIPEDVEHFYYKIYGNN